MGCKFQHCSVNTFGDMALQSWLKRQFSKLPKNASIFNMPYLGKYLTDWAENQNTIVFLVEDEGWIFSEFSESVMWGPLVELAWNDPFVTSQSSIVLIFLVFNQKNEYNRACDITAPLYVFLETTLKPHETFPLCLVRFSLLEFILRKDWGREL